MKNVQEDPQNTRGTAFRLVRDLTSHAQLKMFRPGIRAGVFMWEKFPARLPRSRSQKPRSSNRASPPSHMNTSKFL